MGSAMTARAFRGPADLDQADPDVLEVALETADRKTEITITSAI